MLQERLKHGVKVCLFVPGRAQKNVDIVLDAESGMLQFPASSKGEILILDNSLLLLRVRLRRTFPFAASRSNETWQNEERFCRTRNFLATVGTSTHSESDGTRPEGPDLRRL